MSDQDFLKARTDRAANSKKFLESVVGIKNLLIFGNIVFAVLASLIFESIWQIRKNSYDQVLAIANLQIILEDIRDKPSPPNQALTIRQIVLSGIFESGSSTICQSNINCDWPSDFLKKIDFKNLKYAKMVLVIAGHDSQPLSEKGQESYGTNNGLAYRRAQAVVEEIKNISTLTEFIAIAAATNGSEFDENNRKVRLVIISEEMQ